MLKVLDLTIPTGRRTKGAQLAWFAVAAMAGAACTANEEVPTKAAPSLTGNSSPDAGGQGPDAQGDTGSAGNSGTTAGFDLASLALSGTRLKVKARKSADGAMLPIFAFHDTKFGHNCFPTMAADGKLRCLPLGTPTSFFADAGCTQDVVMLALGAVNKVVGITKTPTPENCTIAVAKTYVHELGADIAPNATYQKSAGKCAPLDEASAKAYSCYPLRIVGAEVSPSEFVELEEVTLP